MNAAQNTFSASQFNTLGEKRSEKNNFYCWDVLVYGLFSVATTKKIGKKNIEILCVHRKTLGHKL